jgi:hypothetical protein
MVSFDKISLLAARGCWTWAASSATSIISLLKSMVTMVYIDRSRIGNERDTDRE